MITEHELLAMLADASCVKMEIFDREGRCDYMLELRNKGIGDLIAMIKRCRCDEPAIIAHELAQAADAVDPSTDSHAETPPTRA